MLNTDGYGIPHQTTARWGLRCIHSVPVFSIVRGWSTLRLRGLTFKGLEYFPSAHVSDETHPLNCSDNRYFENVRRVVLDRLGRLSNDELGGDEDTVMSVANNLMHALPVFIKDYDVGVG